MFSLKFETGSYFLKSIENILYNWTNKIIQHPGSSFEDTGALSLQPQCHGVQILCTEYIVWAEYH